MPGDDLLFHRLGDSTIGAVGFHVRVRDGIGWDTDAMVTRQWSLRHARERFESMLLRSGCEDHPPNVGVGGVELSSANRTISIG